jgi:hypothetical protein
MKSLLILKKGEKIYRRLLYLVTIILFLLYQIGCTKTISPSKTRGVIPLKKQSEVSSTSGVYRALLIGNNNYQSKEWKALKTPINDITKLAEVLTQRYQFNSENVVLLENANRGKILNALDQLASASTEDDNVLVYYAGHGWTDEHKRGYWIPIGSNSQKSEYVNNIEIKDSLAHINAKHRLLISDSCFSGNFLTRERSSTREIDSHLAENAYYRKYNSLKSSHGLSSGGNQPVFDGGEKWDGHSIFAYHLISRLKTNQQKYYSANDLSEELKKIVTMDTASTFDIARAQTPIFDSINIPGHQGGEFFFIPNDRSFPGSNVEEEYWNTIRNSRYIEDFQDYLSVYPNGKFAPTARIKIRQLESGHSSNTVWHFSAVALSIAATYKSIDEAKSYNELKDRNAVIKEQYKTASALIKNQLNTEFEENQTKMAQHKDNVKIFDGLTALFVIWEGYLIWSSLSDNERNTFRKLDDGYLPKFTVFSERKSLTAKLSWRLEF